MTNKQSNNFREFSRFFISIYLMALSVVAPYTIISSIKMTTDVFIGRIIVWTLFWTTPHLIISYLIFTKKPKAYTYSLFLTGIIAAVALLFIPLNYNVNFESNSRLFPLFLVGALYATSAFISYLEVKNKSLK